MIAVKDKEAEAPSVPYINLSGRQKLVIGVMMAVSLAICIRVASWPIHSTTVFSAALLWVVCCLIGVLLSKVLACDPRLSAAERARGGFRALAKLWLFALLGSSAALLPHWAASGSWIVFCIASGLSLTIVYAWGIVQSP